MVVPYTKPFVGKHSVEMKEELKERIVKTPQKKPLDLQPGYQIQSESDVQWVQGLSCENCQRINSIPFNSYCCLFQEQWAVVPFKIWRRRGVMKKVLAHGRYQMKVCNMLVVIIHYDQRGHY